MLIPHYWAERRLQRREGGRQVTVFRLGWSREDPDEAQRMADARAADALARIWNGEPLPRRDRNREYGVAGVPIREQILLEDGDLVLTRNGYGAACLNAPDALFADVDRDQPPRLPGGLGCALAIGAVASALAWSLWTGRDVVLSGALGLVAALALHRLLGWLVRRAAAPDPDAPLLARIEAFAAANPDWHLRLYRTPAGFRLLAMHRTFAPDDPDVQRLFDAVRADPTYVRLCRQQRCFRARVSPKPWRIGERAAHLPVRPMPLDPEDWLSDEHDAWLQRYEAKARGYASCRYLRSFGPDTTVPYTEFVRRLHDELCKADSDLPLA